MQKISLRVGALAVVAVVIAAGCGSSSPTASPSATSGALGLASPPVHAAPSNAVFPNGLLVADRGNGRLLIVDDAGKVLWSFPGPQSFDQPTAFSADDAFFAPDGKTIVANDETSDVIYRIDIATRKVTWTYGHAGMKGSAPGYLHTPDDAYPLANGDIVVADIENCRILEIAPDGSIARQWGSTGACTSNPPATYARPNGDTPLPDGGLLVTEIRGSWVDRISPDGQLVWRIKVPTSYPSDAQLDADGNIIVAGFTNPGSVTCITPSGIVLWRYAPTSGAGRLDHPSLATPLSNGLISINDDFRNRIVVLDPKTMQIVWQLGTTDVAGSGPGLLSDPDGHQPVPANVVLPPTG